MRRLRYLVPAVKTGVLFVQRAWRPLLVLVGLQLLLALVVVVPFHTRVAERLDQHAHAPALAGTPDDHDRAHGWGAGLDAGLWRDVRRLEQGALDALGQAFFWVIVVAWLLGAFAAGGFLGAATVPVGAVPIDRFLKDSGRYAGRMLRVGLVVLVLLYLAGRLIFEAWAGAAESAEAAAPTETAAWWGERVREGAYLLCFFWLRVAADLARADLVVFARHSAVLAFLRGVGRTIRHPVRTFGVALGIGVPAFAALLALAPLVGLLLGPSVPALLVTFVLIQVGVTIRWASRAGVLAGNAHLLAAMARGQRG